ncbi:nose resistant to fluoxetine protein 6-like [Sitophilus oryzae]|uniref:Nose resistant to fluoxetine protein 6-like n=1 Tax=Sitophilus oryzae TaxID=7048 RepID=A0A6J2YCA8_SITOR|nr:nose resistant to fluoxetine protein 6-like [Sitophilus oryzae]
MKILLLIILFSSGVYCLSIANIYIKYFKNKAHEIVDKSIPKGSCSRHLKYLITDALNIKNIWALKMLDASAKLQPGILYGGTHNLGNFDQCIQIKKQKNDDEVIEGQYCTVLLSPVKIYTTDSNSAVDIFQVLPRHLELEENVDFERMLNFIKVIFGVCLPKSCSTANLQKLWNYIEHTFHIPVHVTVDDHLCSYKGKVPFVYDFDSYVFLMFGLYGIFVMLSTAYDMLYYSYLEVPRRVFLEECFVAFSLHKNFKKVFETPQTKEGDLFGCLSGMKTLSMLWVIYGHRFAFNYMSGSINTVEIFQWRKSYAALPLVMAPFSVDTFLVISGLLLAYKFMQIRDILPESQPMPWYVLYLARIARLSPGLLATILFYTSIIKYFGDGPLWPLIMYQAAHYCNKMGISSALFINNLFPKYQCIPQTWYLSVDTQLYMIAPVILHFLIRYPKKSAMCLTLLSGISMIYTYYITVTYKLKWFFLDDGLKFVSLIYESSFVRLPVWMFGMLTGALLYNCEHINISKPLVAVLWSCSVALPFGIAWISILMTRQPYNEHASALYNSLTGPAWALSVCIIVFFCCTQRGGILNNFLSLSLFKILTRISYSIFLIHLSVISMIDGNKRSVTSNNNFKSFHAFLGDLPFIFAVGLLWCLFFESPYINLAKICFKYTFGDDILAAVSFHGKSRAVVVYKPKKMKCQ